MPIISRIGRKHPKVRALYFGMYAFLLLGSVTMVYPFLLMISGSTKSDVDTKYFDVIPRFMRSDLWLYRVSGTDSSICKHHRPLMMWLQA